MSEIPAAEVSDDALAPEDETLTPSHFEEHRAICDDLERWGRTLPKDAHAVVTDPWLGASLQRFETTLTRYHEAPPLLLPHLTDVLAPLLTTAAALLPAPTDDDGPAEAAETSGGFTDADVDAPRTALHFVGRALYVVAKVVGAKACTTHFPHDVRRTETVFYTLQRWQRLRHTTKRREWEVRYAMLLWLSSLVLVPFAFDTVDSGLGEVALAEALLTLAQEALLETSKCREVAALLLARLITRTDAADLRVRFMCAARKELNAPIPQLGVLQGLAVTFKIGRRVDVAPFAEAFVSRTAEVLRNSSDISTTKACCKLLQRLGMSILRQTRAPWRYVRHVGSLEQNLGAAVAKSPLHDDDDKADLTVGDVPSAVEDIIDGLCAALGHPDTVVRWSAAKGVGRVCDRLPATMASDVIQAVMATFEDESDDASWHGGLLAVAELCRRSLLLPDRFGAVVPLICRGLLYDRVRGSCSIGAHVRDAACYVCWSAARAYTPVDLETSVHALSTSLVTASLFDREVGVRRAAAAALQEGVGRLGNFPDGIALVTTMDFFSLAVVRHAYTVVAPRVAALSTAYRADMRHHLVQRQLVHWDKNIRNLAAAALGAMVPIDAAIEERVPQLCAMCIDPAVPVRHGGILALAHICANTPTQPPPHSDDVVRVVVQLEGKRLYRGRGGELLRGACCKLIATICKSRMTLPSQVKGEGLRAAMVDPMKAIVATVEFSWKQPLEWLQREAIAALKSLTEVHGKRVMDACGTKWIDTIIGGLLDPTAPNERRGNAMALGVLHHSLYDAARQRCIFEKLREATIIESRKEAQDAETRRNAVEAILQVWLPSQSEELTNDVIHTFLRASEDYATDKRGDVGSFVRMEALRCMVDVVSLSKVEISQNLLIEICRAVIKQCVEKIDRVRQASGPLLTRLCGRRVQAALDEVAYSAFCRVASPEIQWSVPSDSFSVVLSSLLPCDVFVRRVLEGVCISVGGLSMHVMTPAVNALVAAMAIDRTRLSKEILEMAWANVQVERVTLALCRTLDTLVTEKALDPSRCEEVVRLISHVVRAHPSDISKLLALIPTVASLSTAELCNVAARSAAWAVAMDLLGSRFPKVRSTAAGDMYVALVIVTKRGDATWVVNIDAAKGALSDAVWDKEDVGAIRGTREMLIAALGFGPTAADFDTAVVKKKKEAAGTYQGLVQEAGY